MQVAVRYVRIDNPDYSTKFDQLCNKFTNLSDQLKIGLTGMNEWVWRRLLGVAHARHQGRHVAHPIAEVADANVLGGGMNTGA